MCEGTARSTFGGVRSLEGRGVPHGQGTTFRSHRPLPQSCESGKYGKGFASCLGSRTNWDPPYAAQCGQHRSQAPQAYPASCILHKKDKAANDALGLFSTCIHILSLKMTADILIYHLNVDRSSRLCLL